jgi:hypothetical protein
MFMTGRKRDDFAIKRKFEVVYATSIRKKNMVSVFSGLNDINHLLDQAFSSNRSWLITVFIWSTLWLEYPSDVPSANNLLNDKKILQYHLCILKTLEFPIPTLEVPQLRQVQDMSKSFY